MLRKFSFKLFLLAVAATPIMVFSQKETQTLELEKIVKENLRNIL